MTCAPGNLQRRWDGLVANLAAISCLDEPRVLAHFGENPRLLCETEDVQDQRHLAIAHDRCTGKTRHPGMPQVPTAAEAGLANFELESWVALYAPAGTPPAVLQKLSADVKRSMEMPETKQRADAAGIEVRYLSPAETTKVLERETADWARAIKTANIKMD
jgi:hypothetical protein